MDQHPVPRQITTFEFKLIGFMTLRQFIYLLVFIPLGYVVYKLIPIPFLNFLLGFSVAGIGPLFAFVPFNDRPIDMMLKISLKGLLLQPNIFFTKRIRPFIFYRICFSPPILIKQSHTLIHKQNSQRILQRPDQQILKTLH